MSSHISQLLLIISMLLAISHSAILMSYPAYQNNNWHYDNYGNLMIGNRDNGFYFGPCFGPECPWGK